MGLMPRTMRRLAPTGSMWVLWAPHSQAGTAEAVSLLRPWQREEYEHPAKLAIPPQEWGPLPRACHMVHPRDEEELASGLMGCDQKTRRYLPKRPWRNRDAFGELFSIKDR